VTFSKTASSGRQQEFSGKIYKCPNCGELLKSFVTTCPACGLELRGTTATSAVREFAFKLEAIEARRESNKLFRKTTISKTDEQKINLIRNFSVPNTKEDILEFMILATSNVDASVYGMIETDDAGAKALTDAWISKVKQVYSKAKSSYDTDPDFQKIQELYTSCYAEIRSQKKKKIMKYFLLIGWIPLAYIFIFVFANTSQRKSEAKEIARLEAIVVDVQEAIENREYKYALMSADSIDYQRYDIEMERKWDIEREYWVDKVLEAASEDGVELEYTPTPDVDKANKTQDTEESNEESSGEASEENDVSDGFTEAMQSSLAHAKENIDEFNRIISGEEPTEQEEGN
jgi:hypothetical protein